MINSGQTTAMESRVDNALVLKMAAVYSDCLGHFYWRSLILPASLLARIVIFTIGMPLLRTSLFRISQSLFRFPKKFWFTLVGLQTFSLAYVALSLNIFLPPN
jgi:hypothetical protein